MKKTIALLLILLLTLSLAAGCTGQDKPGPTVQDPSGEEDDTAWSSGNFAAADIDILTGNIYYIKFRTEEPFDGQKMETVTEMAKNGADVAAITSAMGMKSAVILKDGAMYNVDNANKTIYFSSTGMALNESAFPEGDYVFKDSGSADFFGNVKKYESYTVGEVEVRFFFEGDDVIGFDYGVDGLSAQREFLEISDTIPAGIFDIPQDYEIIDLQNFGEPGIREEAEEIVGF